MRKVVTIKFNAAGYEGMTERRIWTSPNGEVFFPAGGAWVVVDTDEMGLSQVCYPASVVSSVMVHDDEDGEGEVENPR